MLTPLLVLVPLVVVFVGTAVAEGAVGVGLPVLGGARDRGLGARK